MKTQTIKTPTSELLIVELAEDCKYSIYDDMLYLWDDRTDKHKRYKGSYTLLGKPDEISEDDARELVHEDDGEFADYKHDANWFPTAKESLLSAIESEIHWNLNPLQSTPPTDDLTFYDSKKERKIVFEIWHEAELRTFDRNRSIIFKKNQGG